MKNGEVLSLYETLDQLTNSNQKFNIKVSYIMAKNKETLRQEAQIIYNLRRNILLQYGSLDENGDIIISKDKINEVNTKINELMEMDNNITIMQINPDDLDNNVLTITEVENLMPMLHDVMYTSLPIM